MMIARSLFVLAAMALSMGAAPALEDVEPPLSVERAVARTIVNALTATEDGDLSWRSVGSRLTGHVHWHLAPPDEGRQPITRTGWIDGDQNSAGLAACGNSAVRVFAFNIEGEAGPALLQALLDETATVSPHGGDWRVVGYGAAAGLLRIETHCRDAQKYFCATDVRFALQQADAAALTLPCRGFW